MARFATILMAWAQAAALAQSPSDPQRVLSLGESGRCSEALPLLQKYARGVPDLTLRRALQISGVKCGMTGSRAGEALSFIQLLQRDFPNDPEVLYLLVHAFSDLSMRASRDLLQRAPSSYQIHQLNAEALEAQGKWDEASAEYRRALEKDPKAAGIHYRLGRLLLSRPDTPNAHEAARKEFEEELRINPRNAGAEYVLGELARREQQWDRAAGHFSRAVEFDAGFAAAHLNLGRSLMAVKRFADAIPALQNAAKLEPANPEPHFHLSVAYIREGRKAEAERATALHKQLTEQARAATEAIQKQVQGIPDAAKPQVK
jgi:tetratricopeptide (TPR) repeat protein